MSEGNHGADALVAFGIGLLVGAAGALLLAPAPGEETRRRLGDLRDRMPDKGREGTEAETTTLVKERVERAFEEGKQAYERENQKS